jgi:hypothetical protein
LPPNYPENLESLANQLLRLLIAILANLVGQRYLVFLANLVGRLAPERLKQNLESLGFLVALMSQ